jgi:hypothetical protein
MLGSDYHYPVDISRFDFDLNEVVDLISKLTGLAKIIELEPRIHYAEESEEIHTVHTEPTFRISCQLSGSNQLTRRLADLATEASVEAVLDHDRTVRFRRLRPDETALGGSEKQV